LLRFVHGLTTGLGLKSQQFWHRAGAALT